MNLQANFKKSVDPVSLTNRGSPTALQIIKEKNGGKKKKKEKNGDLSKPLITIRLKLPRKNTSD